MFQQFLPRRRSHTSSRSWTRRPWVEQLEDRILLATYVVGDNITEFGSLEAAIERANSTPGTDIIAFDFAGAGVHVIHPRNMPAITDPLIIDGWTQGGPGYSGPPLIELDGTGLSTQFPS